jgi:hypothetical protein
MAKRSDGTDDGGTVSSGAPVTDTVGDLAENLGRVLGNTEKSLRGWFSQRDKFIKSLIDIRDRANKLLAEAGHQAQQAASAVATRRGRPPGPGRKKSAKTANRRPAQPKGSDKKTRKGGMSPEGRARVAAAQKARWAAKRAAAGGGDTVGNG